jgi:zinc transport system substrate-binding protein
LGREPAEILAAHIRNTLTTIDPDDASFFDANCRSLVADINREFDSLIPQLAGLKGKTVLVFHFAFGYFFDEFGITQEAVQTGGKEPTAKALTALIRQARKDKVKVIFVQAQFPVEAAKTVATAVGAQVLPLDPLAPDWLDNIVRIGETLQKASR